MIVQSALTRSEPGGKIGPRSVKGLTALCRLLLLLLLLLFFLFVCLFVCLFFRATLVAYGSSHVRG